MIDQPPDADPVQEQAARKQDADHHRVEIWAGPELCLERECEEYFTDDGGLDPGVERCSHIREEAVCGGCSVPDADGYFARDATWPCPLTTADGSAA